MLPHDINVHGYIDLTGLTNIFPWSHGVRYNHVWLYNIMPNAVRQACQTEGPIAGLLRWSGCNKLVKLTLGVNFTNTLRAAILLVFYHQKNVNKYEKVFRDMLVKLTHGSPHTIVEIDIEEVYLVECLVNKNTIGVCLFLPLKKNF